MTSFAFILGVVPLVLAQGAGAEMRVALGVAVFCGMLGVTFFGLFFTPVFYSFIMRFAGKEHAGQLEPAPHGRKPDMSTAAGAKAADVRETDQGRKPKPSRAAVPVYHRFRFAVVLAASLLLAVAQPLTAGLFGEERSFDVFFSLLIVAVLLLVFEERGHRRIAVSLGLAAFLGVSTSHLLGGLAGRLTLVGAQVVAAGFFAFALYRIVLAIFAKDVSGDAIFGTVCGYLLLGIIWSLLFSAVETAFPGSFRLPAPIHADAVVARPDRATLSYYSFITLATVGYGDVTPITPLARTLAWMEAIAGQFYLAVLVAGLVGFKVTQALKE